MNKTTAAKDALKNKEAIIKQEYEKQAAIVREAQKNFDETLKEIPTGWNAMGMQLVGVIVDAYNSAVSAVTCDNGIRKGCKPSSGSSADAVAQNAIAKAEQQRLQLQAAEARYDEIFRELMLHHDNMTQVMVQLTSLDMTKIDYEQLIPILHQAIKYLSEIRVHWGRLIEFFDTANSCAGTNAHGREDLGTVVCRLSKRTSL